MFIIDMVMGAVLITEDTIKWGRGGRRLKYIFKSLYINRNCFQLLVVNLQPGNLVINC